MNSTSLQPISRWLATPPDCTIAPMAWTVRTLGSPSQWRCCTISRSPITRTFQDSLSPGLMVRRAPSARTAEVSAGAALPAALAHQDDPAGSNDDGAVKQYREILQVEEVVLELAEGVLHAGAVGIGNLCPARQPWPYGMPFVVIGDLLAQVVDEDGSLRPGADKAHLSPQDIDELG